jgi:hypothetical protein
MPDMRRRIRSQARPALVWALVFFLGGHLALGLYLHRRHPELCDPEFSFQLRDLRARLTETPDRPLALAVGSSRFAFGFRPASVREPVTDTTTEPVLFNLAMLGVGPVGERMMLHRVVKMGLRPQWLFVEVWPPFLAQGGFYNEEAIIFRRDTYWSDVPAIARLYHRRWDAISRVFAETVTPALHYRVNLLNHCAPLLGHPLMLNYIGSNDRLRYKLDGSGWMPFPDDHPSSAETAVHLERARRMTKPLFDAFRVSDISDKALHDLLEECRTHDIKVALLLMPEHSALRNWYPPIQAAFTTYLRRLSEDYQAPVIDARAWCGDEDIPDLCHLSPRGAHRFSERFGREVYRPILQGRPLAKGILLCDPSRP